MDPYSYLPAWRWTTQSLHSNYGIAPGMNELLTGLASIFFSIGSVMWEILLWVIRFATDTNLIASLAGKINKVVAGTYNAITGGTGTVAHNALIGSILFLIVGYTLFMTVRAGPGAALKTAVRCMVPLALLVVMCGAAVASTSGTPKPPSPGWVANTVNNDIQFVATILPNTVANLSSSGGALDQRVPSCFDYQKNLAQTYNYLISTQQQYHSLTSGDSQIPVIVDNLWTASYLSGWEQAQFGDPTVGQRVGCRYLEIQRNTPAGDTYNSDGSLNQYGQSSIENINSDGVPKAGGDTSKNNTTVYGPFGGDDGLTTLAVTAWASCYYDTGSGSWRFTPSFAQVKSTDHDPGSSTACSNWWAGWQGNTNQGGDAFGTAYPGQTQGDINGQTTTSPVAQEFFNSWNGNNGGASLLFGFFTMLSSAAFLFSIGGLALGTVLAQVLLVLILCALPLLLLVMAMPGNVGKRVGTEALKIGIGAAVSKIIFMLLLGILVDTINIMNGILPPMSGSLGVLITAMTPLIAYYAIHTLLKRMGFGGLMSVKGAVMTTAAITGQAAKDGSLTSPERALRSGSRAMAKRQFYRGGKGGSAGSGDGLSRGPRRLPGSKSDPGPSTKDKAAAGATAVLAGVRSRTSAAKDRMGKVFNDGVGALSKMGRPGAWTAGKIAGTHAAATRVAWAAQRSVKMSKWRASNAFQMKRDRLQQAAGQRWENFKGWHQSAREAGADVLRDGKRRSEEASASRQRRRSYSRPLRKATRTSDQRLKEFVKKTKSRSRGM